MKKQYIKQVVLVFGSVYLISSSMLSVAQDTNLDNITMKVIEPDQNENLLITIPNREIDWVEMLELNGITQQEFEDRKEEFFEFQQEITLENENDPNPEPEDIDFVLEQD